MDLQFGDIQETALVTLAIRASETARPNARIKDEKAKEIIDALGVDVSKFDPFMSHEGVIARTIMYRDMLKKILARYPDLEPRMKLVSEQSYNEEMKKYSIRGKLFAIIGKNINNRLAVYRW